MGDLEDLAEAARQREAERRAKQQPPPMPTPVRVQPVQPLMMYSQPGYAPPRAIDPRNEFEIGYHRTMGAFTARLKIFLIIAGSLAAVVVLLVVTCLGSALIGSLGKSPAKPIQPTPIRRTVPGP